MAATDFSRSIIPVLKEGSTTLSTGAAPPVLAANRVDLKVPLLAATANQHFVVEIVSANIQMLWLISDIACTVYTNHASGSSPDDTVPLTPNVPVHYSAGVGQTNPFVAATVASIYVTVAGAVAGTLSLYSLVTP